MAQIKQFDALTSLYHGITIRFMRTTITLDDDVYRAALHLARSTGQRLGKVLSELARRGLRPESNVVRTGKSRFPAFKVPPDAPVIPASRVQEIIDEEGLF
jgi:hypothetical protein